MRQIRKGATVGLLLAAVLFAVACTDNQAAEEPAFTSEQGIAPSSPSDSGGTDSEQNAFGTEEKPSREVTEGETRTDAPDRKPIELPILP